MDYEHALLLYFIWILYKFYMMINKNYRREKANSNKISLGGDYKCVWD